MRKVTLSSASCVRAGRVNIATRHRPMPKDFALEPSVHSDKSSNLDFLRAIAVLLVYVGHTLQVLHFQTLIGSTIFYNLQQMGVLIFFVHTSLVLMLSIDRQPRMVSVFSFFYIRRAFRIYPLAIVVIGTMILGSIPSFPGAQWSRPPLLTIISNVALVQNLLGILLNLCAAMEPSIRNSDVRPLAILLHLDEAL